MGGFSNVMGQIGRAAGGANRGVLQSRYGQKGGQQMGGNPPGGGGQNLLQMLQARRAANQQGKTAQLGTSGMDFNPGAKPPAPPVMGGPPPPTGVYNASEPTPGIGPRPGGAFNPAPPPPTGIVNANTPTPLPGGGGAKMGGDPDASGLGVDPSNAGPQLGPPKMGGTPMGGDAPPPPMNGGGTGGLGGDDQSDDDQQKQRNPLMRRYGMVQ